VILLVIGSRGSKLALWQANHIKDRLESLGEECRIEIITTTGDRFQAGPLKEIGTKGLFTKEIEEGLLDGSIDLAVHSMKDMPAKVPDGLQITSIPQREDARDVMIGGHLRDLPEAARVGTGSQRRVAQLKAARPDLDVQGIRGNVDTRLRKLEEGQFEAIVLAAAGLNRLGWSAKISEHLPVGIMCPAVGQGALCIETRVDNARAIEACMRLDHAPTHAAVLAERAVLAVLGGGCDVPIGAYAVIEDGMLHLRAIVISPDGSRMVKREAFGSDPVQVGATVAQELLDHGAREILG
jgi:hydroxymethylbilane synthase